MENLASQPLKRRASKVAGSRICTNTKDKGVAIATPLSLSRTEPRNEWRASLTNSHLSATGRRGKE